MKVLNDQLLYLLTPLPFVLHVPRLNSVSIITRDGRIVTFCRIPNSVNRRLISSRFRIRIRIYDVTLPLVYTYKNYSKSCPILYFSVIFNRQSWQCSDCIVLLHHPPVRLRNNSKFYSCDFVPLRRTCICYYRTNETVTNVLVTCGKASDCLLYTSPSPRD